MNNLHWLVWSLRTCVLVAAVLPFSGCGNQRTEQAGTAGFAATSRDSIKREMRTVLDAELAAWYPRSIDTEFGGFYSDLGPAWELRGPQSKFIVTQARHVWTAGNAILLYRDDPLLRRVGSHGAAFLAHTLWDSLSGGFFQMVSRDGRLQPERNGIVKTAYGNAFAIFGLATYARATGDTAALMLAIRGFRWLEAHSHDPVHGGYFQFLTREGVPLRDGLNGAPPKDQNSSIHLLECFTALYQAWPDSLVRNRLQSMLRIVRDTITAPEGTMQLSFHADWSPISYRDSTKAVRDRKYEFDHQSFGHDVETAFLMLDASQVLGLRQDTRTLEVAKRMVDHALRCGWDTLRGGIYDGGYQFRGDDHVSIVRSTKEWWSQVEALHSFLLMADLFPQDSLRYEEKFLRQWAYCKQYLIDAEHGGWYRGGLDQEPWEQFRPKGGIWKGNYHTTRALIHCIRRLDRRPS